MAQGSRDFSTTIADQGILLFNKSQTENFQMLLRSYMEELKQRRGLTNLYASMGWKSNYNEFVIGSSLIRRDSNGTIITEQVNLAQGVGKISEDMYGIKGELQEWVN
ncbi:DUF927 domain-containing protein, partial [Rheinheimera sp.]|uniref:DUF927 domain-containing protein n=1 Tax=Rheinheimera sp. TaxID=1869214 RepID=UPI00404717F0